MTLDMSKTYQKFTSMGTHLVSYNVSINCVWNNGLSHHNPSNLNLSTRQFC